VYRIVNVSDKDSTADIRHFVGLHDIEVLYKQRLANFVKRTSTLEHPVLQSFNSEHIFQHAFIFYVCLCCLWRIKEHINTCAVKTDKMVANCTSYILQSNNKLKANSQYSLLPFRLF